MNETRYLSPQEEEFYQENQEPWKKLIALIKIAQDFNIIAVEVNAGDDLRSIIERLGKQESLSNIQLYIATLDDENLRFLKDELVKRLSSLTINEDKKLVIILKGLENAIGLEDKQSPFLADLNYIRDLLPQDIPHPIIFCLPPYAVDRIARYAPDLWSWMSVITFKSKQRTNINLDPENYLERRNKRLYVQENDSPIRTDRERIEFLRKRLEKYNQSQQNFPDELFYILSELGIAYSQQQDLEQAEKYLLSAEELFNKSDSLTSELDIAYLYFHLGNLYQEKVKGYVPDNLEKAINYYQSALTFYIRERFPSQWAMIENNLAIAYGDRIKGDRADNIEVAIEHYENALTIYTQKDLPLDWAMTRNNLATAYADRIKGDRADNLEVAIKHYENALTIRTQKESPLNWATTENNMGEAYRKRIKGDHAYNLEVAIEHYENALTVFTKEEFPLNWAMTQNNLGIAYCQRIKGDRADNLEVAIKHYENALTVKTQKDFPLNWANTESNLGNAYLERIKGDRADNLEVAIKYYENALTVRTQKDFPVDWAMTENNLANAYSKRIKGDRTDNLETAIKHFENALKIRTPETFPLNCLYTRRHLADIYYEKEDWLSASESYGIGIQIVESLLISSSDDTHRQEIIKENYQLFERIAECYRHLQQPELANTYLEKAESLARGG